MSDHMALTINFKVSCKVCQTTNLKAEIDYKVNQDEIENDILSVNTEYIEAVHNDRKDFNCETCDYTTSDQNDLKIHGGKTQQH